MRYYEKGSDIWFGDFDDADFYHIEQTSIYQKRMNPRGISTAEFLLIQSDDKASGRKLLVIEAKKTLAATGTDDFHANLKKIARQFMDSLLLAFGIWLGSHDKNSKDELPLNYIHFFENGRSILFVLVIKKREEDMINIADTLKSEYLRKERRILGFDVLVMNEEQAQRAGLVMCSRE